MNISPVPVRRCVTSCSSSSSGQSEAIQWEWLCVFQGKKSVYKAVERHTSPSWYWAWVCDAHCSSWPLKLSLWNSLVMADRDFPLVSGRNRPTYSADNKQTAPKGTKQNSLNSLCKRKGKRKLSDWRKTRCKWNVLFSVSAFPTYMYSYADRSITPKIKTPASWQTVLLPYFLNLRLWTLGGAVASQKKFKRSLLCCIYLPDTL